MDRYHYLLLPLAVSVFAAGVAGYWEGVEWMPSVCVLLVGLILREVGARFFWRTQRIEAETYHDTIDRLRLEYVTTLEATIVREHGAMPVDEAGIAAVKPELRNAGIGAFLVGWAAARTVRDGVAPQTLQGMKEALLGSEDGKLVCALPCQCF